MLLAGDEVARTQRGNNNAWCQDNELAWFDWEWDDDQRGQLDFTRRLIDLRARHPVLRSAHFPEGAQRHNSGLADVWWFRTDGRRMTRRDWEDRGHVVGVFLNGQEIADLTEHGHRIIDDSFLLLFNGGPDDATFALPSRRYGGLWTLELCTHAPELPAGSGRYEARAEVAVPGRSLTLLRRIA